MFTNKVGNALTNSNGALDKEWFERKGFGVGCALCKSVEPPDKPFTLHGFRTSMSTWAEEQDGGRRFPSSVIEAALAHVKKNAEGKANKVTGTYLRNRYSRRVMNLWTHGPNWQPLTTLPENPMLSPNSARSASILNSTSTATDERRAL